MRARTPLILVAVLAAACLPFEKDRANIVAARRHLERYKTKHYEAIPMGTQEHVGHDALLDRSRRAGLLLIGDYHTDRRLHWEIRKILRLVFESPRPVRFLVECVGIEDQALLDAFLDYELGIEELSERISARWSDNWLGHTGFDRDFYRDILLLARRHGVRVQALEPTPRLDLSARDARMARSVMEVRRNAPAALPIVLVGHTHLLGDGHLRELLPGANTWTLLPRNAARRAESSSTRGGFRVLTPSIWILQTP